MKQITVNGSEEFDAALAEVKRNNWRVVSLSRGDGNADFVFCVDCIDDREAQQEFQLTNGERTAQAKAI